MNLNKHDTYGCYLDIVVHEVEDAQVEPFSQVASKQTRHFEDLLL